jgi:hypothetical protein
VTRILLAALALLGATLTANAAEKEPRLFELRVYTLNEGKLDIFAGLLRDTASKLYVKHGMTPQGYFVPLVNKDNAFYILLAHESMAARTASWAALRADTEAVPVFEKLKADKVVAKAQETFLNETDYSAKVELKAEKPERIFELRTYTTTTGNLAGLDARFRDHTCKLFEKHGMTNLWYYHLTPESKAADATMVYFLAHKSAEARTKSFDDFRQDPKWDAARLASEKKAGGSLTTKDGVKSVILKPTDFSPLR